MSDPIADLLTRIRNAISAGFPTVEAPASRLKEEICRVLKEEGYIRDFAREDSDVQGVLKVTLKYAADRTPVNPTTNDEKALQGVSPEMKKFFDDHAMAVLTDEEYEKNTRATADYIRNIIGPKKG